MRSGKDNEMGFALAVLKSPDARYNAASLARHMNLSAMGSLKIARRLEKDNVIISKKFGNANSYSIRADSSYAREYVRFALKREAEGASPYIKRWIREMEKIKNAEGAVLFGSLLKREKEAGDIDALIIVHKKSFEKVKKEIEIINMLNDKKIHPLYQTREDLRKHINEGNKVILNAVKGIAVSGEDAIIEALVK